MKREITDREAVGKAVKGFLYSWTSGQMIVYFDRAFTTFGVLSARGEEVTGEKLRLFAFGDDKLIEAGILSIEELEERRAERDERWRQRREAKEAL